MPQKPEVLLPNFQFQAVWTMFSAGGSLRVRALQTSSWELDLKGHSAHSFPRIVETQESKYPTIFPLPELLHPALSLELIKE